MKQERNTTWIGIVAVVALFVCLVPLQSQIPAETYRIRMNVLNPNPNCWEKEYTPLQSCGAIRGNDRDSILLVKPAFMQADNQGNLFVFDTFHTTILQYDRNGRYVRHFGREGQGPGELTKKGGICMYLAQNNTIRLHDARQKKIVEYAVNGSFIREYRFPANILYQVNPLFSTRGLLIIPNIQEYFFSTYTGKGEKKENLIPISELYDILYYKPNGPDFTLTFVPHAVDYDLTRDDTLIVYIRRSSTLLTWKNGKILNKVRLWPKNGLELYKESIKDKKRGIPAFGRMFLDKDDEKHVYVQLAAITSDNRNIIYCFDLQGKLIKTLYCQGKSRENYIPFYLKKNQTFYATSLDEEDNYIIERMKENKPVNSIRKQ